MLLTALPPAPPTPNTVMRGFSSSRCEVTVRFNAIVRPACFFVEPQLPRAALSLRPRIGSTWPTYPRFYPQPPPRSRRNIGEPHKIWRKLPRNPRYFAKLSECSVSPVVLEPFEGSFQRSRRDNARPECRNPTIRPADGLRKGTARRRRKSRPGRRLRQALHAQRAAHADPLAQDAAGQIRPGPGSGWRRRSARSAGWAGGRNPRASSRARTSSRISSTRGRMMPISSVRLIWRRSLSQSPVSPPISIISRSSMPVACTPPCMVLIRSATGKRHLQALGDVGGDMVAAHPHGVGIDHVLFHEDRNAGRRRRPCRCRRRPVPAHPRPATRCPKHRPTRRCPASSRSQRLMQ